MMCFMSVRFVLFFRGIFAQTTCPWNGLDCSIPGAIVCCSFPGGTDPGYVTCNGAYRWVYSPCGVGTRCDDKVQGTVSCA